MTITVIGGGHGGLAAAADLALRGFEVRLWRRNQQALGAAASGLTLIGPDGAEQVAQLATPARLEDAIEAAQLIVVALPAPAMLNLSETLRGLLRAEQTVLVLSGNLTGLRLRESGAGIVETSTLPYAARKADETHVRVLMRAMTLPAGAHKPLSNAATAQVQSAFPEIVMLADALDAFLINPNIVVHSPRLVCSLSSGGAIHAGSTDAANALSRALDRERTQLREALGYGAPHFSIERAFAGLATPGEDIFDPADLSALIKLDHAHEAIDAAHRYVSEDIAHGLALWLALGEHARVPMPIARALYEIACTVFSITHNPLRALGLKDATALAALRR